MQLKNKILCLLIIFNAVNVFSQVSRTSGDPNSSKVVFHSRTMKADIAETLNEINTDSVRSYIQSLQNFTTRFEAAGNRFEISEWILNKFKSFGYEDVKYDNFSAAIKHSGLNIEATYQLRNVLCTIPGYGAPEEKFILCAHYDSFSSNTNPFEIAPGADDNASGISALLEIARVLAKSGTAPKRTIILAALAGEELMNSAYSGSMFYAAKLAAGEENVKLVINHDMIGYTDQNTAFSSVNINRELSSSNYAELAKVAVENYSKISANHSSYWGADLRAFVEKGYKGIYFEESVFNPFYHTNMDLLNNMNVSYCTEVIKGSCATAIWASSMPNAVAGIEVSVASESDDALKFIWNSNRDFDLNYYVLYLSVDNGKSYSEIITSDTTATVGGIADFGKVKYAVAAVSSDEYESFAEVFDLNITSSDVFGSSFPEEYRLEQNYPNPFNPATKIKYQIKDKVHVNLMVFDILGRKVSELVNKIQGSGNYEIVFDASELNSGIYIYKLTAGKNFLSIKKMLLIK